MIKVTTQDIIKRFQSKHGNYYDYSKVNYKGIGQKVEIICPIHGSFFQFPSDHSKGCGCSLCASFKTGKNKRISLQEFIHRSNEIHNFKFDYSNIIDFDSTKNVNIICPIHGSFFQNVHSHLAGKGCRKCKYQNHSNRMKDDLNDFLKKAKFIHGDLYNYDEVEYIDSLTKIRIKCEKHGIFEQLPNSHINNHTGCPKCKYEKVSEKLRKSSEQFILDCQKIHGNKYDYSKTLYSTAFNKVEIICEKHGSFFIQASDHLTNKRGCPSCSFTTTKPEIFLETFLKNNKIEYLRKNKTIIKPLELDFHIPSENIAIEFNGIYWHSEITGQKNKNYHLNKTELCEKQGIRLIHIFENEYLNSTKILLSRLKHIFGLTKYKISARKCEVREIDFALKNKFVNKYHIQGDSQSKVNLGLFHKNRLVQVMTFSKSRIALGRNSESDVYELSRLCSIHNFSIIGGPSKLLKYFEMNYKPIKIISYADRRYSTGNVYRKLGFELKNISKPNYWYFTINNSRKLYHRYMFAKHMLSKKLKSFDPLKSEWENMKMNNYDRIFDCGNLVFEKIL